MTADPFKDLEHARKIANTALTHMRNCEISAVPKNYRVWFEFFSGDNPVLRTKLGSMIDSNVEFEGDINEEIFKQCFDETSWADTADEWTQRIEEVVDEIFNALKSTGKDTEDYDEALHRFSGNLSNLPNFKNVTDIESLAAGLINDTKAMGTHLETLRSQVTSSTDQITQLKQELAAARRDALTDGLTGVANRKCFDDTLKKAAVKAEETLSPLSLILADLDHFKSFNDTHGHQIGDQVLKVVGQTLIQNIKGQDTAARYGGEEFAIILPNTSVGNAVVVAENIRKAISSYRLRKKNPDPEFGSITVSMGVSSYVHGEALEELIERTDKALYEAKKFGRNRVMLGEGTALQKAG